MTSSSEDEDYLYRSLTFRSVLVCKSKTIPEETAILDISTAIVNIIAILPAILGNVLILLAIRKTSSIAMPTKVLLGSLAFTDLGVGLLAQPLYAVKTLSSDVLTRCVSGVLFDILSGHLSITSFFSVMFISLDRFMALHLKLRYRTVVTLKRCLFIAVLVRLVALPWGLTFIWMHKVYFLLILTILPICLVISSLSFIKIYLILRRKQKCFKTPAQHKSLRQVDALTVSRYRESVNSMFIIFCALLVAYIPAWIVVLVRIIYGRTEYLDKATTATLTIVLLNSTVNPILYLWRMKDLRQSALEVIAHIIPISVTRRKFQKTPLKMLNCALCGNSVAARQFSCLSEAAENGSSVWDYFITSFSGTYRASTLCCSFDAQSRWLLLTSHLACSFCF